MGRMSDFTPHFLEWQKACGRRNEAAHAILESVPDQELKKIYKPSAIDVIKYRAERHKPHMAPNENGNLEEKLETTSKICFQGCFRMALREGG